VSEYPVVTRNDLPDGEGGWSREFDRYLLDGCTAYDDGESVKLIGGVGPKAFAVQLRKEQVRPAMLLLAAIVDSGDSHGA
jgi:hypothetical protein